MQYLLEKLNVLKEYKKTLDFLCWFTIIRSKVAFYGKSGCDLCYHICHSKYVPHAEYMFITVKES